jgi:hypothetical protein
MNPWCTRALALSLVAPAVGISSATLATRPLAPNEIVAFETHSDPSLGSLRAGRVDAPTPLGAAERPHLAAAQAESAALGALRGGMSDDQLTWLLLGGAIVLLLILVL